MRLLSSEVKSALGSRIVCYHQCMSICVFIYVFTDMRLYVHIHLYKHKTENKKLKMKEGKATL